MKTEVVSSTHSSAQVPLPHAQAPRTAGETIRAIVRVTSGNFLEQFDFFLFGFYASQISHVFFPTGNNFTSLMLTFATFGAGFLMRPLGAVILGTYIDKVGRRKGLIVTLSLMATGTVTITFIPGYEHIGLFAPALVLIGRLIQGFSAGAELGGVSVYLSELAAPGRKGLYASWQSASQQVSIMVAALLGFVINLTMDPTTIAQWGWRVPFLVGCLIIPLIFILRRKMQESPEFAARAHQPRPTLSQSAATLVGNWQIMVAGTALVAMTTAAFYMITVYTPTFGKELDLSTSDSLMVTLLVAISNFIWLPIGGMLSDRFGRKVVLLGTTALAIITCYGVLSFLAASPSFMRMLCVLLWISLLYGLYNGAMIPALAELMPQKVRVAGFSIAYSLATAIFGGFTPEISTALIHFSGDRGSPGLWVSFAALCAMLATLWFYRPKAVESRAKTANAP
ncbi:MAG: MFS transporter [Burkholderiaceae bacterium]|jgi:MHS family citrate/tricarballylate:H+ symporter-like MFS transporter|nr:MFS transporter [Burkholderiaceae bacterium]